MYLGKALKAIKKSDKKELKQKEARCKQRNLARNATQELKLVPVVEDGVQNFQLVNDGCCFPKARQGIRNGFDTNEVIAKEIRQAGYVGSFSVDGENLTTRTEFVQRQLKSMHTVEKSSKVQLVFSLSGVKVCSSDGEYMYMAHAWKTVSIAVCDPENRQFAFLASQPHGQFCHVFTTTMPKEAEDLNRCMETSFRRTDDSLITFGERVDRHLFQEMENFVACQEEARRVLECGSTDDTETLAKETVEEVIQQGDDVSDPKRKSSPRVLKRSFEYLYIVDVVSEEVKDWKYK